MGAACYDAAALVLGLAVAAALLACQGLHRCAAEAQATSPGCMPEMVRLTPCMGYMSGNATAPGAPCCAALSGVLAASSTPRCLCAVLGGTPASLGVAVDGARARRLPGACKVEASIAGQCDSLGIPMPSPATPGSTPVDPSEPNVSPQGPGSKSSQHSIGNIKQSGRSLAFVIVAAAALDSFRFV